jgi:DNA mismatch endonuclease (patch repair protein)
MPDKFSKEIRSKIMSRIRSKDTKPEIAIRKILWSKGKRYRVHDRTIFGTPDISNRSKKATVFIDGCFWHGCNRCCKQPLSNTSYWKRKIGINIERRRKVVSRLGTDGWKILEFWEHDVDENPYAVAEKIAQIL